MACNIIYKAVPSDLNSEMPATFTKNFDFFYPEADFPLRTFEKSLMRFWVHYEAVGAAKWLVEAFNRREEPESKQLITIPPLDDGSVQIATFDMAISDEVIRTRFTTQCGPCSIIYVTCDFAPGGQVRKNV